jgi:hypothetical protein
MVMVVKFIKKLRRQINRDETIEHKLVKGCSICRFAQTSGC